MSLTGPKCLGYICVSMNPEGHKYRDSREMCRDMNSQTTIRHIDSSGKMNLNAGCMIEPPRFSRKHEYRDTSVFAGALELQKLRFMKL